MRVQAVGPCCSNSQVEQASSVRKHDDINLQKNHQSRAPFTISQGGPAL